LLAAVPSLAQRPRVASVRAPAPVHQRGVAGYEFIPGFGSRPVVQERHSFGGFHHRGFRRGFGFRSGFGGFFGGFHSGNFFGYGYLPFYPSYQPYPQSPTVIIVQQPAPYPAAERVITNDDLRGYGGGSVVVAGLPENWDELNLQEVSLRRTAPASAPLTLLALKDETIFPVVEHWLEDGLIFYVTSTGRQGSLPLRALDWEMTSRLNAERGVEFALRSRD
jgi:hypothetical protein